MVPCARDCIGTLTMYRAWFLQAQSKTSVQAGPLTSAWVYSIKSCNSIHGRSQG